MNLPLFDALSPEVAARLVAVLLHSLWQASLLAGALWLTLRCLGAARQEARYRLSVATLAAVVALAVFTWAFLDRTSAHRATAADGSPPGAAQADLSASLASLPSQADALSTPRGNSHIIGSSTSRPKTTAHAADSHSGDRWSIIIVGLWLAGMLFMLLRVAISVRASRRFVQAATALDAPLVTDLVDELRRRLGLLRRVRVMVCGAVRVPAVLGVLWPVLLLPPALVTGVSAEQLRVILAHELAHVRRYDYLINLGQLLVEAGLFFNPAVWWISRRIRIERETCCDALAVSLSGERLIVARTLVDYAQAVFADSPANGNARRGIGWRCPATSQAFDGQSQRGALAERVRRILLRDEVPRVRLPWYTQVGLLLGACGVLIGLDRGSRLVAQTAADWLTPAERVEKLAQVAKDYAQPTADAPQPSRKLRISGTVRMADGSPLPPDAHVGAVIMRAGYSGLDLLPHDATGHFSKELSAETVYLQVRATGQATTYEGPFLAIDGDVDDVEVFLDRGFSTRIRFVNQAGEPVPGVVLEQMQYTLPKNERGDGVSYAHSQHDLRLESDADGYLTIDGCSDWPSQIDVRPNGYQFERQQHHLQADATLVWKLERAQPMTGRVVDDATGQPIAGAQFYLAQRSGFANAAQDPRAAYTVAPRLAVSDHDGRFELGSLRDDCRYAVYVQADDYAVQMLRDVRSGRPEMEVRLGPPLYIKGRILGNLDSLPVDRQKSRYIKYRNPITLLQDGGYDMLLKPTEVRVENGEGRFEINQLFPGRVTLELPGCNVVLDVREPIEDYTVDLDQPDISEDPFDSRPQRSVVLRFELPPDAPAPRGQLQVGFGLPLSPEGQGGGGYRERALDITGNELRFDAPVGSMLMYRGDKLVGYWIEEGRGIPVKSGDDPLRITVEALPAGGVFGRVLTSSGNPASDCNVHVLTVEKAARQQIAPFVSVNIQNADGRFVLGQLPLGGRYRLMAGDIDSEARALSDIVTLNEEHSLEEMELRFVEGETLTGQVLDPDGSPVVGAELRLEYSSPHGQSFGGVTRKSGRDGRFRFEHVNLQLDGEHVLAALPSERFAGTTEKIGDASQPVVLRLERAKD